MSSHGSSQTGSRGNLRIATAVIWTAAIGAAYLAFHSEWIPGSVPAIAKAVADLALVALMIGLAGGVGKRLLPKRAENRLDALEWTSIEAAVGAGAMGLTAFVVGVWGLLYPWILWMATGVGWLLFGQLAIRWWGQLGNLSARFRATDRVGRLAAMISALLCLLGLLQAMAPPLKWDALVYHLTLPAHYLDAHTVLIMDDTPFLGMPQLVEMLYTWAMALGTGTTAAVFGWAAGCLMLVGTIGFATRLLGDHASFIPAAVLLSGATISRGLGWAYVDHFSMLFGLTAVIALDGFRRTQERRDLLWAATLSGFAVGVKYSNLLLLAAVGIALLVEHRPVGARARSLVIYLAVALTTAAPWFVKNAIVWENPVYPLVVPGGRMETARQAFYAGEPPARSLLEDLLLPAAVTLQGMEGGPGYAAEVGPLLLGLIPCLLLGWRAIGIEQRESLKPLAVIGIVYWIAWAAASHLSVALQQSRLYFSAFPALALLAAGGVESIRQSVPPAGRLRHAMPCLTLLVFGLFGFREALNFVQRNPVPVLSGAQGVNEYLADRLGWYEKAMEAVNRLPPGSRVLMLWEPRAYYCEVECLSDSIIDRWYMACRKWNEPEAILRSWRAEGATHVLYFLAGREFAQATDTRYSNSDWSMLDALLTRLKLKEDIGATYLLYEIPS